MAKGESINVRVTLEEKNKLGVRTVEAGLFTISDYVRQVLFVHDRGLDLREGLAAAIKEMKAQGETMKEELQAARAELQAARETTEAGVLKMTEAGNAEIMRTLETFLEKCQDKKDSLRQDRQQQEEKYIADPWLYPFGFPCSVSCSGCSPCASYTNIFQHFKRSLSVYALPEGLLLKRSETPLKAIFISCVIVSPCWSLFVPWWLSLAVGVGVGAEFFRRAFPMIYHIPLEKFSVSIRQ